MQQALQAEISAHMRELGSLCEQFRVARLFVFGSAVSNNFDAARSDFDFLAQFQDRAPTPEYADRFMGFEAALHALFKRPVDLVTVEGLKPKGFRTEVERTRRLVYDASHPSQP